MVPNPGMEIGFLYIKNLEMLRFYLNHCRRIQRPFNILEMTLDRLTFVYQMKEVEDLQERGNDQDARQDSKGG
jgi:hypothetical protein